ncbi:uncharacterized protein LOC141703349 [Apium graveolens]|uniref:uncharacterized protein LOC141703349 n=1 Tax=Apium graveolens TaxID=4045 RepID=UPI003D79F6F9
MELKDKAYEEMYIGIPTNEGANGIYKLTKARERRQRDLGFVRFIKDKNACVLVKDNDIKCRCGEETEWESVRQSHCDSNIQPINGEEIELALRKMGKGKATSPDEIPIENKSDAQNCSNFRGIKLLSHTIKLWEQVIEIRLRSKVTVSENQFGFMPGRSTMEAIHLLRHLMEKFRERRTDLHMVFIDLKKAYDSVSRNIIWTSLESKGVS